MFASKPACEVTDTVLRKELGKLGAFLDNRVVRRRRIVLDERKREIETLVDKDAADQSRECLELLDLYWHKNWDWDLTQQPGDTGPSIN